ncbi:MAG TPA: SBBP repeat-containing protein [Acidimicrobiia bacterium]|nr:SBBP repeat-containing protein [Acidimicrobiia bacterium]
MQRASRLPAVRSALAALASVLAGSLLWPASAPAATVGWTTQFGTSYPDDANGLAIDRSGNLFAIGQTSGEFPGQKNAGMIDAFLRRYDPAGGEVWTRQFGSAERDIPKGLSLDSAGNVYLVGQTFGTLPGQVSSAGGWDAFLRKYTPAGEEVWTRQFGGGGGESAASVRIDQTGNAYVVGGTRAALPGQTNIGDFDSFIVKFDPTGSMVWARQFGTTVEDYALTVSLDAHGNPIVAGETSGRLAGAAAAGGLDGFVRQYSPDGDVAWTRQFGSALDDFAVGSAVGPSGDVFVVGSTAGALPGHKSAGEADAFIVGYDGKGGEPWSQQFGTKGVDDAEAITFDAAGNAFVAGRAGGALHGSASGGGSDAFLAAAGPTGDILWVHQVGGPAEDYAMALAVGRGGFYLAGSTTGALPGQKHIGQRDAFVVNIV